MQNNKSLYDKFLLNIAAIGFFETNPKVAVALSGGVDSMTLTLFTNKWIKSVGGKIIALTVNHNLRRESFSEALQVQKFCKNLDVEHHILEWKNPIAKQKQAREARYKLLTEFCCDNDILHLFVGHHRDDRVENFFIRLSRGSGIFGLIDTKVNFIGNVRICKPLFDFKKSECDSKFYVEDSSNFDTKYLRNEVRINIQKFLKLDKITPEHFSSMILKSQNNLLSTAQIIQKQLILNFIESVCIYPQGFAVIFLDTFDKLEKEAQLILFSYLLTVISGKNFTPRFKSIDLDIINVQTLHGCIIVKDNDKLTIYKELGKKFLPTIKAQNSTIWDNRFKLYNIDCNDCFISGLDFECYKSIKKNLDLSSLASVGNKHKEKILFTLPIIKKFEKIIAIPNIGYYEGSLSNVNLVFMPQFISKILSISL